VGIDQRQYRRERFVAAVSLAVALLLFASMVAAQTGASPRVIPTSRIIAPSGTTARDYLPPPTVFDEVIARDEIAVRLRASLGRARDAVPIAPWNRWGLARTEIRLEDARKDEASNQYFVDLADGRRAWLTLDPQVQEAARSAVSRYADQGRAIVAIEPSTGRVLAIVNDGVDPRLRDSLARSSWPWAASVFKVISGAAFLAEGIATRDTVTCYPGGASEFYLADLTPRPNETLCRTLVEAMAHSSNLVFARIADRHLPRDRMRAITDAFAFNTRIPFEAPVERSDLVIPEDRLEYARLAAGFRHSHLSPLHAALIFATIANDGVMMVPTLVDRIEGPDGEVQYEHEPLAWRRVLTSGVNAHLVDLLATTAASGTAASAFYRRNGWPDSFCVWGKTGTLLGDPPGRGAQHRLRWFAGFARRSGGAPLAFSALSSCSDVWHATGSTLASEFLLRAL
jgi:peptidoglycan glycosyltransferase